jgi:adenylate cyclase
VSETRLGGWLLTALLAVLFLGLPVAVWLDLRTVSEHALRLQAGDLTTVISEIRDYYASNVVGRVLAGNGQTTVSPHYRQIPGAIPIPATFSLELGSIVGRRQHNISYRFVSDFPFRGRARHVLDRFERDALATLRRQPQLVLSDVHEVGFSNQVRFIVPVIMGPTCVACHNADADSPRHDWKVGDVRGIQEVSITQPVLSNIFSLKYLLLYVACAGGLGLCFIALQRRQAKMIVTANRDLVAGNARLTSVSEKVSRYVSPQVYQSIFHGRTESTIHTKRKKLTIFFSDIVDFTAVTERLQPEDLTALLNEYFTEMSYIALQHGGTIDKFVGDAILIFFGDPESKGVGGDARACLRMAVAMRQRLSDLNVRWRLQGIEQPLRMRMGINTGFCNVGNFGSSDRMDYTIIGLEANIAARLQAAAEPDTIVVSQETYLLVHEIVDAHALDPLTVRGSARSVVPMVIDGLRKEAVSTTRVFSAHNGGLDFYLDPDKMSDEESRHVGNVLREAVEVLERRRRSQVQF